MESVRDARKHSASCVTLKTASAQTVSTTETCRAGLCDSREDRSSIHRAALDMQQHSERSEVQIYTVSSVQTQTELQENSDQLQHPLDVTEKLHFTSNMSDNEVMFVETLRVWFSGWLCSFESVQSATEPSRSSYINQAWRMVQSLVEVETGLR